MNANVLNFLKKLPYMLGSFLTIIGGVSAIGMALASHEWVIAVGSLCVCGAAIPTVANWIKKFIA